MDAVPVPQRPGDHPPRRFICPACRTAALEGVSIAGLAARCVACGYEVHDLLSLVPVRPAPLSEMVLGTGLEAGLRLLALGLLSAFLLGLLLGGR